MRTYKGLKVPVEPEKKWRWMRGSFSCDVVDKSICMTQELPCPRCIYSKNNQALRKQFYEETFKEPEKENKEESFMEAFARKAVKKNLPDLNTDTIPVEFVLREKLCEGTLIGKWYTCIALVETSKGLVIRGTDNWREI